MKVTSQHAGGTLPSMAGADAAGSTGKLGQANFDKTGIGSASSLKSSPSANTSEKVNLSQRVLDMQKIKELATPQDSIDESKVARLQKLIDDGEYKVDADAVADRLVDDHMNIPS